MDLYPLCDCLQRWSEEVQDDEVEIYYFTDNPSRPYDAFVLGEYDIPKEAPLYLCVELWRWNGVEYEKVDRMEVIPRDVDGEKWCSKTMNLFTKKYLIFMVPKHEFDFSYSKNIHGREADNPICNLDYANKMVSYYNQGNGGRWDRAYAQVDDDDEMVSRYGPIY